MCGICGVVQLGGAPREVVPPETLRRMMDTMTHRGPDDRGALTRPGIAIGANRLSIIDVEGGHQPFANETERIWAAQNGEPDNHDDLRRDLERRGHSFRSRCDTEILPHLYEEHGDAFPERLNGMFAIAIWDEERRRTVLARDRLGIKPLYYARAGDLLVFGSELKVVLRSGLVATDLDPDAIEVYLDLGFFPAPATPLAAVRKLRPGHRLIVDENGTTEERYWSYPDQTLAPPAHEPEWYAERLLGQLEASVVKRLMSDVPLGAMLSGGLDSSLIVGLMARNTAEPVKTFSIGFEDTGRSNELEDARHVSRHFGTEHHEIELPLSQPVDWKHLVWHLDEPLADLSFLGFFALSRLASEHVTVALSGQGADELLGGYRKHVAASLAGKWQALFGRRLGSALVRPFRTGRGNLGRLARTVSARDPADRLLATSSQMSTSVRSRLLAGPMEPRGARTRQVLLDRLGTHDHQPLAASLFLDAQLGLADDMLHYFDRASMAFSLEVRVPFLDHEMVELCAGIPLGLKVGPRMTTKHVLKLAARGIVPERIIHKPKIGFFHKAVGQWLEAQMGGSVREYLLDGPLSCGGIVAQDAVTEIAGGTGSTRRDPYALLVVLMLEIWLRDFLPRARNGS